MRADAIILAGGRASRMGGVDKPAIEIGGRTMLDTALRAAAECANVVVVGPHRDGLDPKVRQVQEQPRGSGPVAAIGAGLTTLRGAAPVVVILAADMPFLRPDTVAALVDELDDPGVDAACAIDESGKPQYLVGVWRTDTLSARLAELGSLENLPMKALLPAALTLVPLPHVGDCDTPDDVARATRTVSDVPSLSESRNLLRTGLTRLSPQRLPLREALGATLAEPLTAAEALPRFDVSAMDGYAVTGSGPWRLRTDIGYAGGVRPARLQPGEAVRIATGAHVPDGADTVVRDEFVEIADNELRRLPQTPQRDDIRHRGEDWSAGHELAEVGTPVTLAVLSTASSAEVTELTVRGPVRAHVVVSGDEIRRTGPLRAGQTRDSIGPIVPDLLAACGVRTISEAHLRDTPFGFDDLLSTATEPDLIVVIGATGGGAADQLRSSLDRAGARILVHRVGVRPGGSQITAELPDGRVVLGLPGNPYAAVSTLLAIAPTIAEAMTARRPRLPLRGVLTNASEIVCPVTRLVPACRLADGSWTGNQRVRTAHLAGLVNADALAVVPPATADGDSVELIEIPR